MHSEMTVTVVIPDDPDALGVLRSVAAGLAALADLSFDAIEDVCLAVDEAALQLMGSGAGHVEVAFTIGPEGLEANATADGAIALAATADGAIGRHILAALVDELDLRTGVRFFKRSTT